MLEIDNNSIRNSRRLFRAALKPAREVNDTSEEAIFLAESVAFAVG